MSEELEKDNIKDRRGWLLLVLSVFAASVIWLLHALSLQYSAFLEYYVELKSAPDGKGGRVTSNDKLIVRCKTEGYNILIHRIGPNYITMDLDTRPMVARDSASSIYTADRETLREGLVQSLPQGIELEFIVTEKLDFILPTMVSKRVPVVPKYSLDFADQYMPVSQISLKPDSIDIYGDIKHVSIIDSVWTETISYKDISSPVSGICSIVPIRWISFSDNQVYYSMDVSRYYESKITLPIIPVGVPEDKEMIVLPSEATLTYRKAFGGVQPKNNEFQLTVDYNDYINSISSKVIPRATVLPKGVLYWEVSPRYVDCVVASDR